MNIYFSPISSITYLFSAPHQEEKSFPQMQAILDAFNHFQAIFSFYLQKIQRIWRVLSLLSESGFQILNRIMCCYHQSILNDDDMRSKEEETESMQLDEEEREIQKSNTLCDIFNEPISYEQFRDNILNFKKRGKLFYSNYSLETYLQLKERDLNAIFSYSDNTERELNANIATYDAIVNLYVSRFLERNPQLNDDKYLPSLRVTALGIAIKISWDEGVWNIDFKSFISPYMGAEKHREMESKFLKGIDWNFSTNELLLKKVE